MRDRLALLLAMTMLLGCSATGKNTRTSSGPTLPYHLLIAPTVNESKPADGTTEGTYRGFRVEAGTTSLDKLIVQAIRDQNTFRSVRPLPVLEREEDAVLAAVREQADFILETRVRRRIASYLGRNHLFIPNILLSIAVWPVAWFVRDETYALDLEVEAELRSWSSGIVMHSSVHRVREEKELSDFGRGWLPLSLFRIPGSLDESNWMAVNRSISPDAEAEVAYRVAEILDKEIRKGIGTPEFRQAFTKRYAVVIGISQYKDYAIRNLRFADIDAHSFLDCLEGPEKIPSHNTMLLLNDQATLGKIREAVEKIFALGAGEDDEIIIYFAGYGAWRAGEAYLVPHDADSDRLVRTGFPISDLWGIANRIQGPRVTLIIDAPFVHQFRGRAAAGPRTISFEAELGEFLVRPGRQVLTAGQIGQGCVELEDVGGGLFTHYLIEGLEGKGDRNRDGRVTWEEAARHAGWMVGVHAPLEGKIQSPGYFKTPETLADTQDP
ncbi:MAG: caspase family protein [Planctomycetota bacterium]|nr:caspase family protein [Planctomycetota bacterium]